jgi:hypothetical protein
VFVDKHPLNTLKLPLIARLFPQAKILFAVRDPRDVVLSCFRRRFKLNPAMYEFLTLRGAAAFYTAVMEFSEIARSALNLHWHTMRYESVVTDFEAQMRSLCGYIGITWERQMGEFADRVKSRELSTPSTAQLSRGLVRSGMDQWRHYEHELEPVLATLSPWVEKFGYSVD